MIPTITEPAQEEHAVDARRPGGLELVAGTLLLATVVLHVIAMFPTYYQGTGSLVSQPDQAALYSVLAASWALALAVGLTGPHRTPVAAALAVGVAVAELGFRVADSGDAFRYGTSTAGVGLWLMDVAWFVGSAAAVAAALAARSRHSAKSSRAEPEPEEWRIDWSAPVPAGNPYADDLPDATPAPAPPTPARAAPAQTAPAPFPSPSAALHPVDDPHERMAWTLLVAVLAIVVAGAFLPAWDHAIAYSTSTGQTVTRSLGNAFSGPWQQVLGTLLAAAAFLVVPIVAIRLRNKAVGAAMAVGGLLVLASQLVSAVVQVDETVPAGDFGISPAQAHNLGLQLSLKLTGWFTVDALAAYALFAAVMVWATVRHPHENSVGTAPSAP